MATAWLLLNVVDPLGGGVSPLGLQRDRAMTPGAQTPGPGGGGGRYVALGTTCGKVAFHNLTTGNCVGLVVDLAGAPSPGLVSIGTKTFTP